MPNVDVFEQQTSVIAFIKRRSKLFSVVFKRLTNRDFLQ